jgi:LDH2 family malate/lactate/ureidoglycolate dehydrogenase
MSAREFIKLHADEGFGELAGKKKTPLDLSIAKAQGVPYLRG